MKRILLFLSITLIAATVHAYEKTYALIVAVADYKNYTAYDGDLRYTTNDARLFYEFLRSEKGGSVPAQNIVYLTNYNASKANIIAKGRALFSKAQENDRVIFYFSGHGSKGCFVPYDAGDSYDSYLYFSEVKAIFRCSDSKTKLLFADACNSGSMKGLNSKNVQSTIKNEKKVNSNMNIAVMMSCRSNEYSLEVPEMQQGLFTYYLIRGLSGLANTDKSKYITIKELYYYVYKNTKAQAAKRNNSQHPELFGKFDLRLIVAQ